MSTVYYGDEIDGILMLKYILAFVGAGQLIFLIFALPVIVPEILRRRTIKAVFPDAVFKKNDAYWNYKSFRAELHRENPIWRRTHDADVMRGTNRWTVAGDDRTTLCFKVILPEALQKELANARFQMIFEPMLDDDLPDAGLRAVLPKQCFMKSSHPMMQRLTRDQVVLKRLAVIEKFFRCQTVISLRRDYFSIEISSLLSAKSQVLLAQCGFEIFERVIAAAAAVNPAILSISPIAENFTVTPAEFLDPGSDEERDDALNDDPPMEHRYADSESRKSDDYALPGRTQWE